MTTRSDGASAACGSDARGVDSGYRGKEARRSVNYPGRDTEGRTSMPDRIYWIDTGVAIHLPQTPKIAGRKQARSIHGYLGNVVTREQAKASNRVACPKCFPHGWS